MTLLGAAQITFPQAVCKSYLLPIFAPALVVFVFWMTAFL